MVVDLAGDARVAVFHSSDVDEAVAIGTRVLFSHTIKPVAPVRPFSMDLSAGKLGTMTAGILTYGCEVEGTAQPDSSYVLVVSLGGTLEVSVGSSDLRVDEATAVMTLPQREVRFRGWTDGTERLAVFKFDASGVEAELRSMLGRDVGSGIHFMPALDLRAGTGAEWRQLADTVIRALETRDGWVFNPLLGAPFVSTLTRGLLLALDHQHRAALDVVGERVRPRLVQRAVRIIEERSHEALTMSGIAAEVGCSVRALRYGFQSFVGLSPSKYLARVRMQRVHEELMVSSPDMISVSEILYQCGVTHAGRFAAAYRAEYGVLPSVTLRSR